MKVFSSFSSFLIIFPNLVAAQIYGDEVGCQMLAGERPVSDNMYLYDGATIQRVESSCPVTGSLQVGSGGILLTVECSGEGETWEDYYLLSTTSDPDHYIIHPSDFPEFATDIRVCEVQ